MNFRTYVTERLREIAAAEPQGATIEARPAPTDTPQPIAAPIARAAVKRKVRWTPDAIAALVTQYRAARDAGTLAELAVSLGRSMRSVWNQARALGLTSRADAYRARKARVRTRGERAVTRRRPVRRDPKPATPVDGPRRTDPIAYAWDQCNRSIALPDELRTDGQMRPAGRTSSEHLARWKRYGFGAIPKCYPEMPA